MCLTRLAYKIAIICTHILHLLNVWSSSFVPKKTSQFSAVLSIGYKNMKFLALIFTLARLSNTGGTLCSQQKRKRCY